MISLFLHQTFSWLCVYSTLLCWVAQLFPRVQSHLWFKTDYWRKLHLLIITHNIPSHTKKYSQFWLHFTIHCFLILPPNPISSNHHVCHLSLIFFFSPFPMWSPKSSTKLLQMFIWCVWALDNTMLRWPFFSQCSHDAILRADSKYAASIFKWFFSFFENLLFFKNKSIP